MVSPAQLSSSVTYSGEWSLLQVAGRFAEISGSKATAALTLACGLVLDAQKRGEPVGWATSIESFFVRRIWLNSGSIWRHWWSCACPRLTRLRGWEKATAVGRVRFSGASFRSLRYAHATPEPTDWVSSSSPLGPGLSYGKG